MIKCEEKRMLNLKIISFKHGLFWRACCEIPAEERETYYFDNEPFTVLHSPVTLYCVGLTCDQVNRKMVDKLKQYFKERKEIL